MGYDLSEFHGSSQDGTQDFSAEELRKMEKKIHESGEMTKLIMQKVVERAKTRNGVLDYLRWPAALQGSGKLLTAGRHIRDHHREDRTRRNAAKFWIRRIAGRLNTSSR
ncbi:hypothetical protein QJS64_19585 (plasmid) [Paraclostridium bifermentans]|uniref:Uncharacterized protein n=1 Tax=Paraclostridium bifermentans TaxID=1490 RepID=A0ABY8R7E1_PARBF|nr:hypothetical protein QJS64_19585 [Paraclostridium bifermentans]